MTACPVCEYTNPKELFRLGDRFFLTTNETFPLYECGSCGLLFQDFEQIGCRLDEFYPPSYWWKPAGKGGALEQKYREWVLRNDQVGFLKKLFREAEGIRLLDIGCGTGSFVGFARNAGFDAWGLDNSETAVEEAQSNGLSTVMFRTVDQMIADGELFDLLSMFHVLEHVTEPFSYLKKVRSLLRKPGGLIVQVPNRSSYQARLLGRRWYGLDCPRHVCNYTLYALQYLLGRAGFTIRVVRHFSLRDNAPALVSSMFPSLDPMSQRVKRSSGTKHFEGGWGYLAKESLYFGLVQLAQPAAWVEAKLKRGATVTIYATWD